jgi:iron complex transport system ATP-binding protein
MTGLEVKNLACGYRGRAVIGNINLTAEPGEVICILGPNGVGKTTFFKTVLGLLPPLAGQICWWNNPVHFSSNREKARFAAYVPQTHTPPFPYLAREVVVMGRVSHLPVYKNPGKKDYAVCDTALERLRITRLANRAYTTLSGGERQMVLIARALVQEPAFLMMDEPTSNLDYGNQFRVLKQIIRLAGEGLVILMTTHSPVHAALCATKVVLFQAGKPVETGKPEDIITEANLRAAYGVDIRMFEYVNSRGRTVKICVPIME